MGQLWLKDDVLNENGDKKISQKKGWKHFELNIIIPDSLPENLDDKVAHYRKQINLSRVEVGAENRFYNFYLDIKNPRTTKIKLYDMPTTLSGISTAIKMYVPRSYMGERKIENLLIERELMTFSNTLKYLISNSDETRENVKLISLDV